MGHDVRNQCKVCGYQMPYPPVPYNICPSCGVEYGTDTSLDSYLEIRNNWLAEGGKWFSEHALYPQPPNWNAWDQLDQAGLPYDEARPKIAVPPINKKDPLRGISDLLTGPSVKLRPIADRLGLKIFGSDTLPEGAFPLPAGASGMLTKDTLVAGFSGFGIVIQSQDPPARQRFTAAHEVAHYLLHADLLKDEPLVDMAVAAAASGNQRTPMALYRSALDSSLETKADSLAANILAPWHLLTPLIKANERAADIARHFKVSKEVVDIRLWDPVVRRLKQGVTVNPSLEAEFNNFVEKWNSENPNDPPLEELYRRPDYQRIRSRGMGAVPLFLRELRDHPRAAWIAALKAITSIDPAPDGYAFGEAVKAWLAWGRDHGWLK